MFYDVRFDAIAPKSADSTEQEEVIRLIINVEAQTKFKPGYSLTKRAIYYCSRMISAQHGQILQNPNTGKFVRSVRFGFVPSRQMVSKTRLPGTPLNRNS